MNDKIKRLLYSKYSKYIISFVLGFGLATLFRKICKDKSCYKFKSPKIESFFKKFFEFDNDCISYSAKPVKCDLNKKIIEIA